MQTRFTSAAQLKLIFGLDDQGAERLRALVKGQAKPDAKMGPSGNRYADLVDSIMVDANQLLQGHGVEAIQTQEWIDGFWGYTCALYVNAGDTYRLTLLYDVMADRFVVASWRDWYEKHTPERYRQ